MEAILEKLVENAKSRVEDKKKKVSFNEVKAVAEAIPKGWFPFDSALKKQGLSFILEVKRATPAGGAFVSDYQYLDIAKDYEQIGADAIAVVTEPKGFLGDDRHLTEIGENVRTPIMRQDYIVDPYMIYEAKMSGACGVVLDTNILSEDEIREYIEMGDTIGVSSVVVVGSIKDIETAINAGARIIGINNRKIEDDSIDFDNMRLLRHGIPKNILVLAMGGVRGPQDISTIKSIGADGVLVGESMVKAHNRKRFLQDLRAAK